MKIFVISFVFFYNLVWGPRKIKATEDSFPSPMPSNLRTRGRKEQAHLPGTPSKSYKADRGTWLKSSPSIPQPWGFVNVP